MTGDLFAGPEFPDLQNIPLAPGALLLRGRALPLAPRLLADIGRIIDQAPLQAMTTPGGRPMSVTTSSCGDFGWVSDARGYRYERHDPRSGRPWPAMPAAWREFATAVAAEAGFAGFVPDACLINRYAIGARMGLHQDRDERDFAAPIVSVSLGLTATFLFGGSRRSDPARRLPLAHGDVVVWGPPSRMAFHGIAPLQESPPPTGSEHCRYNLTFRKSQ